MSKAINDIIVERERQKSAEGWTPEHDDAHGRGQMANAAAAYAHLATLSPALYEAVAEDPVSAGLKTIVCIRRLWPWDSRWFKPKNPRRDLVRAAALIVAEIERIDRKDAPND